MPSHPSPPRHGSALGQGMLPMGQDPSCCWEHSPMEKWPRFLCCNTGTATKLPLSWTMCRLKLLLLPKLSSYSYIYVSMFFINL